MRKKQFNYLLLLLSVLIALFSFTGCTGTSTASTDSAGSSAANAANVANTSTGSTAAAITELKGITVEYSSEDLNSSWDVANATAVTLNGTFIQVSGSGAKVNGSTLTITAAGTFKSLPGNIISQQAGEAPMPVPPAKGMPTAIGATGTNRIPSRLPNPQQKRTAPRQKVSRVSRVSSSAAVRLPLTLPMIPSIPTVRCR